MMEKVGLSSQLCGIIFHLSFEIFHLTLAAQRDPTSAMRLES